MTDEVFMAFLRGYAYAIQMQGYGNGPVPDSFKPIVPYFKNEDGTMNREQTLDGGTFTGIVGTSGQICSKQREGIQVYKFPRQGQRIAPRPQTNAARN